MLQFDTYSKQPFHAYFSVLLDQYQAQESMGTMGLPVLISVLQEDRDDLELLQGALEVLYLSCSTGEGGHSPPGSARKAPAAGQEVSSSRI